jgi:hypothetical protein
MNLITTITETLASHDMDWNYNWSEDGPALFDRFCSCGVRGFGSEDEHRASVAIATIANWLEGNGWDDCLSQAVYVLENEVRYD